MRTIDDRTGLEVLAENECLLLLGRSSVGRLAVIGDDGADLFPVNFRRAGRSIVFRTDEGTKLGLVASGPPVAFEVDEYDTRTHVGWSVVVRGSAHDVTEAEAPEALRKLRVQPWATGPKARYVRIVPERIEGRRIVHIPDVRYSRDG
jgi:nitroimidazol reductase NimA-like FMN-containing flavoprotein (pyridoxamine 5'-phosphate oxidase superfamily)